MTTNLKPPLPGHEFEPVEAGTFQNGSNLQPDADSGVEITDPSSFHDSQPAEGTNESFFRRHRLGSLITRHLSKKSTPSDGTSSNESTTTEALNDEEIDQLRKQEILESPLLAELPENERAEAAAITFELYKTAKEVVAPVVTGFADYLLSDAGDRQIIFAGRDGLGAYLAAGILKEKFEYPNHDPNQLVYAYLTRKIVQGTPKETIVEYLKNLGVENLDKSVVLADIGMYGTILPALRRILSEIDVRYLISKAYSIPGYADGQDYKMESVSSVIGNPAIHFLEDTFSGPIPSPSKLEVKDGEIVPDTLKTSFSPKEALMRQFALKAIEDYARSLNEHPEQPATKEIQELDHFLSSHKNYAHLMVPHIR